MPDGFTGNFFFQVDNACNPTLGQNGQGVCGVRLVFDHEYLGDLSITLTSPSGQSVQLVGPTGFFGPTDFTTWDVTFVPCGDAAAPDAGFSAQWNNNQPWGLFGNYTGAYYPRQGCLEGFNTGPVNGQWRLTVTDLQAVDVGNFTNYEIIFCDPSCINCFSCAANAGNLPQPDVTACAGSAVLDLNLPPVYVAPNVAPSTAEYGYTYVISGPGGVIQGYDPNADLSTYPPGNYTVCGLSYLLANEADIPAPNGTLTTAQLSTQLNSNLPPFCGKITNNCVNVVINQPLPDEEETVVICAPNCYTFHNQTFCQTGTYTVNLTQNGCPYQAVLYLTRIPQIVTVLSESICAGECSAYPGFEGACVPGLYQQTFTSVDNCDSLVRLTITVLTPLANIVQPQPLGCSPGSTVSLQGAGSSNGSGVTYRWTASNGGNLVGNTGLINATANAPGDYQLRVCRTNATITCCDSTIVTVFSNTTPPPTPAFINGPATICEGQTVSYSTPAISGATSYTWTVPAGVTINTGQNTNNINITWSTATGGEICVKANNLCDSSGYFCKTIQINQIPVATQPQGPIVVCSGSPETYFIPTVVNATNYIWTVTGGTIAGGQGTAQITVNWGNGVAGTVCVRASNICGNSPQICLPVQIKKVPAAPNITGNAVGCAGGLGTYNITASPGATAYNWTITNGTITGGNDSTSVVVTWNTGVISGSVCVNIQNACGLSAETCFNVAVNAAPAAPVVTGSNSLCSGSNATYTITPIVGNGYVWTVPAGATIVSGQNTTSINVNWGNTSGNVCAAVLSNCGTGPQGCFAVVINAVPNAVAGPDFALCGNTYTLQATPSVGIGQWTQVSGPGTAVFTTANAASTGVTVNTYGAYTFRWSEINGGCTDADQVTIAFNASPVAGIITTVCDPTNQNYTVSFPITSGTAPYTSSSGTVSSGICNSELFPSGGQGYIITISDANGCSTTVSGNHQCNCTTDAGLMSLTLLTACEGTTVAAMHTGGQILDADDTTAFVLHTNNGPALGTIFGQNHTGVFSFQSGMTFGTTYYISLVAGNNLSNNPDPSDLCFAVSQGQPVIFYQNPTADAGADTDTCGLILSLQGNIDIGLGTWTTGITPAGGSLAFSAASSGTSNATASLPGLYTAIWTLNNNGCSNADTVSLAYNASPATGTVQPDCDAANENYTITFPISSGTPPYSVNGNVLTGNTFNSSPILSNTAYSFAVTDANGCAAPVLTGSFLCNCTTSAGTMSLTPLSACEGATVTGVHLGGTVLDGNDTTAYILHSTADASVGTVFAQNTTGIFSFQAGMSYGVTYYISFIAATNLNGSPDSYDPCLDVALGQPVVFYQNPVANAGADAATCSLALTLEGNVPAGTGTWTTTGAPAGATLSFVDAQSGISDATASQTGIYQATWTVTENGCIREDVVQLTFNENPTLAGLVRTCDPANENFTVTLTITGGTLPYAVNGTSIANSVFTSAALPNGQTYTFNISDVNGCTVPQINGAYSCNCSTDAGTMSAATLTACEGTTVTTTANNDQNLDGNDITAFVLHTGASPTLGTVVAQNTTGVFGFQSGMTYGTTYYISRVIGNPLNGSPNPLDPCFSVAPGQPVVFLENPAPNAGADATICGNSIDLPAIGSNFSGVWTVVSGPGSATFADSNAVNSNVTVATSGAYTFRWTEQNGICIVQDDVVATFNSEPVVGVITKLCDPTNTTYTITYSVTGGLAPYTVSNLAGTFSGNTFTSDPLASASAYAFHITDANGCESPEASGSKKCDCTTDAGSMVTAPLTFCAGQNATVVWNNDGTADGNDIIRFILHDQSGTAPGIILATADQPSFPYLPSYGTDKIYYISAIAGNNQFGLIDLNDPCLSVAPGTPVQWKALPTASLTGDVSLCNGQSAFLTFIGTGTFPLNLTYSVGAGTPLNLAITGTQSVSLNVTPTASITYQLLTVTDNNTPACSATLTDDVTVVVNQPVTAGTIGAPVVLCTGTAIPTLQLRDLLTGESAGGVWTQTSAIPSTGTAFNANNGTFNTAGQPAGNYTFHYKITAIAPCPDAEATVQVIINQTPAADAGPDKMLDCSIATATLGGPGTSTGSAILYQWTQNGTPVGTTQTLPISTAGLYNLLVSTPAGCSATDNVTVLSDSTLPSAKFIVKNVRCFGDKNGRITLDSIHSIHPPVLISLDGAPFSSKVDYFPLLPGVYNFTLQDASGCEWGPVGVPVTQPPQLTASLGADITVSLGDLASITLQLSIPLAAVDTIIWSPLLDTAAAGQPFQQFFPIASKQITVRVVDKAGCATSDRLQLILDAMRNVYVPNIIDPTSTSGNAVATVFGGPDVEQIESFRIYDRWGERLFESLDFAAGDLTAGWAGKFRGQDVAPGVYIFYAVVRFKDNKRELFKGDITIFR